MRTYRSYILDTRTDYNKCVVYKNVDFGTFKSSFCKDINRTLDFKTYEEFTKSSWFSYTDKKIKGVFYYKKNAETLYLITYEVFDKIKEKLEKAFGSPLIKENELKDYLNKINDPASQPKVHLTVSDILEYLDGWGTYMYGVCADIQNAHDKECEIKGKTILENWHKNHTLTEPQVHALQKAHQKDIESIIKLAEYNIIIDKKDIETYIETLSTKLRTTFIERSIRAYHQGASGVFNIEREFTWAADTYKKEWVALDKENRTIEMAEKELKRSLPDCYFLNPSGYKYFHIMQLRSLTDPNKEETHSVGGYTVKCNKFTFKDSSEFSSYGALLKNCKVPFDSDDQVNAIWVPINSDTWKEATGNSLPEWSDVESKESKFDKEVSHRYKEAVDNYDKSDLIYAEDIGYDDVGREVVNMLEDEGYSVTYDD